MISRPLALRRLLAPAALFALSLLAAPSWSHADSHTWVSGVGDDANPGTRWAPCKTFAGAISKTDAGGIITVLDPGGFGAVTITKAITIEGDDQQGSILVSGTSGVIVNIANAGVNDIVTIRNLNFEGIKASGGSPGINGISILKAGAVHIEHCQINGFLTAGINISTSNAGAQVFVDNTTIHNVPTCIGIQSTASATLNVSRSHLSDCGIGVSASSISKALISDTTCTGASTTGYFCAATTATMTLVRCTSSLNGTGVMVSGPMIMTECEIFNNTGAGLKVQTGGKITSFGTNTVRGNNPDGAATATTANR